MVEITQVRAWGYGGGEHPFSCAGGAGGGGVCVEPIFLGWRSSAGSVEMAIC